MSEVAISRSHRQLYSYECEQAIISLLINDADSYLPQLESLRVQPFYFYHKNHQEIYRIVLEMNSKSLNIDPVSIFTYGKSKNYNFGGLDKITAILEEQLPLNASFNTHLHLLIDLFKLRAIKKATDNILDLLDKSEQEADNILEHCEREIFAIRDKASSSFIVPAEVISNAVYENIQQYTKHGRHQSNVVDTSFTKLDDVTGGFKPGEMIVIAARPGIGKTALALSMVHRISRKLTTNKQIGLPITYISLEMTNAQLFMRLFALASNIHLSKIINGQLNTTELKALKKIATTIGMLPIYVDDGTSITIGQLSGKLRRLKRTHDIKVAFIDYLQLLTAPSGQSRESRQVEVSIISRNIKRLSLELNIPIIVLAQLNRRPDETTNNEPALHHLRESGAIEQDADLVLLLSKYNTSSYKDYTDGENETINDSSNKTHALYRLFVAKNRNGPAGMSMLLEFDHNITLFKEHLYE